MEPPWQVLVNRAAGRRELSIDRVKLALAGAGVSAEVAAPASILEMREAVAAAAATWGRLAVAGGDGTVNLAVNTLLGLGLPQPPLLGVLPGGTGCDLLRTFGISQNLEEAARHLLGDGTYRIDVGKLEGDWGVRYFVNVAQTGAVAAAVETALRLARGWGKARYFLAFLVRLPGFPRGIVEIDLPDRQHRGNSLAAFIANGQFFGGGWNVAPRSNLTDGRVDLQVVDCRKWEVARLVPKIMRGVHLADPAIRRYSTDAFTIRTSEPWPIEADGDMVGNTPVRVSVIPAALDLKI